MCIYEKSLLLNMCQPKWLTATFPVVFFMARLWVEIGVTIVGTSNLRLNQKYCVRWDQSYIDFLCNMENINWSQHGWPKTKRYGGYHHLAQPTCYVPHSSDTTTSSTLYFWLAFRPAIFLLSVCYGSKRNTYAYASWGLGLSSREQCRIQSFVGL